MLWKHSRAHQVCRGRGGRGERGGERRDFCICKCAEYCRNGKSVPNLLVCARLLMV